MHACAGVNTYCKTIVLGLHAKERCIGHACSLEIIILYLNCRISAQVYNTQEDYIRLADAVVDVQNASHSN